MATIQSRVGPGRFQWNTGGWFGGQIGSTVWLLGAAVSLLPAHVEAAVVAFLSFLLPNLAGVLLYRRRDRIAPYPALQALVLLVGAVSFLFVLYVNRAGLAGELDPRFEGARWGFFMMPALFGGLMVAFHFMERAAVKRRGGLSG